MILPSSNKGSDICDSDKGDRDENCKEEVSGEGVEKEHVRYLCDRGNIAKALMGRLVRRRLVRRLTWLGRPDRARVWGSGQGMTWRNFCLRKSKQLCNVESRP